VLIVKDIVRRFGHAATDRQAAYLSAEEIKAMQATDPVGALMTDLVRGGYVTRDAALAKVESMAAMAAEAFAAAKAEPRLTSREQLEERNSSPLAPLPPDSVPPAAASGVCLPPNVLLGSYGATGSEAHVMRKHMTSVFDQLLAEDPAAVYYGEDVQHGGYYLVTDGLSKKHAPRVQDFPPDETSLLGAAMGAAHAGLHPILEIPYAKYLDCAMDLFTEASIMHWLSNGRQPNGMVIRLQGFGRGVFGGNYHTHNTLHIPPGLDVVCYSNGRDYSRGMRHAFLQSRAGRVVMSVDCTELLNMREVAAGGPGPAGQPLAQPWEFHFTAPREMLTFDDVILYRFQDARPGTPAPAHAAALLLVTYGNGLPLALQLQQQIAAQGPGGDLPAVDVCDCPLLSAVPAGLAALVGQYGRMLLADPCKEGQSPLAAHMAALTRSGSFAGTMRCIAAPRTYNPLGTVLTFLSRDDMAAAVRRFAKH
jgi:2-oxoisovalerate dehydrogenase E1 component